MPSLKEKGVNAFKWDFIGNIANHSVGLIISIILARILQPSEFGLLAMVIVIISMAQVFTDIGLGSALIQRHRLRPAHFSSVFYFNLLVGCTLCLCTYLSAPLIASFYNKPNLIPITELMSILFIINALSSVQTIKLQKSLNLKKLTKLNLYASIISGIFGVSLALNGAGVWSLVIQALTSAIFFNVFIWSSSEWFPSAQFSLKALKTLWRFGFRMFIATLIDTVISKIDIVVIGKMYLAATLGYYQRAKTLNTMVAQYTSSSLVTVLFPILSQVKNDLPRFQNIVIQSLGIISFISFLLLGTLFLISNELIVLLFSDKWIPSVVYFKIIVLSGFGYPIGALLINILMSRGKSKTILRLEIIKKSIFMLNVFIGFTYGIEYYLYGLIIVTTIGLILNAFFASDEIQLKLIDILRPVAIQMSICAITVGLIMLWTQNIELSLLTLLCIKSIAFILLYIFFNILCKSASYQYTKDQATELLHKYKQPH